MTKQIERIVDAVTGEVTERELTQTEIDANASGGPLTPLSPSVATE
jgi:hypothetical protein